MAKKEEAAKESKETASATPVEPAVFAVVRTGGKQYRVSPGQKISVEKLDIEAGEKITFSDVLMAGKVGGGEIKVLAGTGSLGVTVTGRVVGHVKDKKVIIFKKRQKGGYTKKQGHRQQRSEVIIEAVAL